ncbi:site-specific integrase [Myroides odoratimimus]|nr:site-specific integrase [Myroides odoratimimus]MDM1444659.1 site-specific integrase [Myroides odoratimimus]MEC4054565.1 site-specific integrase [Myroides odoratimimus]
MKAKNTFGIHFVIRAISSLDSEMSMIYARVTVNGQRTEISLKIKISSLLWDSVRGKLKGKSNEVNKINEHIERVRSLITDSYHTLIQQKKVVSIGTVKTMFLGMDDSQMSVIKLIEYHNTISLGKLTQGTLKNYTATTKYIKKFLFSNYNRNDIFLNELNYKFIFDFESYLRSCKPIHSHQPLSNNGIMKHLERVKKLVNLAVTMEWIEKDPFSKFKLKYEKTSRSFLSRAELDILVKKRFKREQLQAVLDMFLFCCYTGLAFIDIFELKPSNIVVGSDNKLWIFSQRVKTKITIQVPLLPEALKLIEKYKCNSSAMELGKIFPVISNQKMNAYLKQIGSVCKINKNLSFHMARHTFATTLTLNNGVPMESVSKMLGHTAMRTTQIYAKVLEYKLSEDMENLRLKMIDQDLRA